MLQTYLPGSCKKVQFHQELLVFFWKICDINKVSFGGGCGGGGGGGGGCGGGVGGAGGSLSLGNGA